MLRFATRRRLLAVSLLFISAIGVSCSDGPTTPSDASLPIVYAYSPSNRFATLHIWAASADGTHRRQLDTLSGGDLGAPSWSPDGQRIAFVQGYFSLPTQILYVMQRDGSALRRVATGPYLWPVWFPDGQRLLVTTISATTNLQRLAILDVQSGTATEIPGADTVAGSGVGRASLSPDGTRIAYECSAGICEMSSAGGASRTLIADGRLPSYSPDGTSLSYFRQNSSLPLDSNGLSVMNLSTGATRSLFPGLSTGSIASWSPDGSELVYAGTRVADGGTPGYPVPYGALFVVSASGGMPRNITTVADSSISTAPAWSPSP